jgi:polysaccharide export outer membrane protein
VPGSAGRRTMRSRLRHLVAGAMFVLSLTAMAGPQVVMAQTKPQPEAAVPSKNPAAPVLGVETPAYLDQVVNSAEYVVGPGDRLFINVWGERPEHLEVTITPEATLIVPAVGEIDVRGLRLDSVKAAVQGMMTPLYPRARLSVTLAEVRRFRVTVTGEVETPGLHIVTANTRASEVLDAAGLKDEAARRQVRLQRSDTTVMVDLAAFERLGLRQANPYLAEGDVLIVPPHDPRWGTVEVSGSVRAPGRFG